jgi:MFS family permease
MNASSEYQPRSAWAMTVLLTGLALINFLDKVVVGMVAVPMTAELHLSPARFGMIAGGFFWLFSISTIAVGLLSNRFATRWLLLAMGVAWTVIQVPQALTTSALSLLACRVLLGAAEGPFLPITIHALYKWFPDRKRNLPVSIVSQGAGIGLLLAGLFIPQISQRWGWRTNFMLLGAIGVIWCLLWLAFGREGNLASSSARAHAHAPGRAHEAGSRVNADLARRPLHKTLADPSVLCVFLLGFAAYWSLSLVLTWLPTYLEKGLGYSGVVAGRWFAVVVIAATPVNVGLSWFSQTMLERGVTTRVARVKLIGFALMVSALLYAAPLVIALSASLKVLLLAVGSALPTVCFAVGPALLAEVVPDNQRGAVLAIHTAVASLGAAFSPVLMGAIVQAHGTLPGAAFETGFASCAVLVCVAALCSLRWLHPDRSRRALRDAGAPQPQSTAV